MKKNPASRAPRARSAHKLPQNVCLGTWTIKNMWSRQSAIERCRSSATAQLIYQKVVSIWHFFNKLFGKNMSKFEQNLTTFCKIRISSKNDGCKLLNFFWLANYFKVSKLWVQPNSEEHIFNRYLIKKNFMIWANLNNFL